MVDLILTTFDWVPETPRGYVRDIRVRWALEEAGLPYRVEGVPFRDRSEKHFAHQPFGQVPILEEDSLVLFESGAIVLHIGERSEALLPAKRLGALADTVRRVEYYHVTVSDKPGEGERILSALKESEINLLAYLGFPTGVTGAAGT